MAPDTRVNCVAPGFVPTYFAAYITKDEVVVSEYVTSTLGSSCRIDVICLSCHGLNLKLKCCRGRLLRIRRYFKGLVPRKTWLPQLLSWRPMMLLILQEKILWWQGVSPLDFSIPFFVVMPPLSFVFKNNKQCEYRPHSSA